MPEELKDKIEPTASKVMRTPRSLDIEITARCNLRCRYCYFFNNPAVEYRDLPTDEWLKFFDELGSLGVMNVTLAGGEPFIREDLTVLLLEGLVRNRMRFSLLSNGALIDDEMAAFIARTGRCEYVQVSVDGSCAEVHDYLSRARLFRRRDTRHSHPVSAIGLTWRCVSPIHRHNIA